MQMYPMTAHSTKAGMFLKTGAVLPVAMLFGGCNPLPAAVD